MRCSLHWRAYDLSPAIFYWHISEETLKGFEMGKLGPKSRAREGRVRAKNRRPKRGLRRDPRGAARALIPLQHGGGRVYHAEGGGNGRRPVPRQDT